MEKSSRQKKEQKPTKTSPSVPGRLPVDLRFDSIVTKRLLLRRLRATDADMIFSYHSNPTVVRDQLWHPVHFAEVEEFVTDQTGIVPDTPGTWFQLAICRREDGIFVGDCGMYFPENDPLQAEIGYTLIPSEKHHGYATEAVRAILGYLFGTCRKHRVTASVNARNTSSIALLKRIGMQQEAHFREDVLLDGIWCDSLVYAILEREWNEHAGKF